MPKAAGAIGRNRSKVYTAIYLSDPGLFPWHLLVDLGSFKGCGAYSVLLRTKTD